jgi:hypothetical protein
MSISRRDPAGPDDILWFIDEDGPLGGPRVKLFDFAFTGADSVGAE